MSMTVRKPNVVVPAKVGSCTLPNTPTSRATTAPATNAARGTVMLLGGVLTAIGSGSSWLYASRRRTREQPAGGAALGAIAKACPGQRQEAATAMVVQRR